MRVVTPAPRDVWREVLQSDPKAFVYQTPEGIDAICAGEDQQDVSRLYEFDDGRRLVLPLHRPRGRPSWLAADTSPFVGSIVSDGPVEPRHLKAVFADLAALPALRVRIFPTPMEGEAWDRAVPDEVQRVPRRAHVLDLEGGFDTVWMKRFKPKTRRDVRLARKAHVEVELGQGDRFLTEYSRLLRRTMKRLTGQWEGPLGWLAGWRERRKVSEEKLRRRVSALGNACRIWLARLEGEPAAAILVLQGPNAHNTMSVMNKDLAGPTRANFLLHKHAIEDACEAGCRYYTMGLTGTSDSLAHYKRKFGAEEYRFNEYRIERFPFTAVERRIKRSLRGR
ncbi:MAG: GNAT family N-acetyltransferase [Longimicrobiales bacterium]|nr:GNAT family N-acetyltransferase [Longimicrobiales bacterium]